MGFMRTWSAFSAWKKGHPERKARIDGGEGDVIDDMFEEMKAVEGDWKDLSGKDWWDTEVDVEWGGGLIMAKKL